MIILCLILASCGGSAGSRQLDLTFNDSGLEPTRLEAYVGEQVFIRIRNDLPVARSLTIELRSGQRTVSIEPGVDSILTFPATDPGTFRYFCPLSDCAGIEGEITILP
jgi:plastocyanin